MIYRYIIFSLRGGSEPGGYAREFRPTSASPEIWLSSRQCVIFLWVLSGIATERETDLEGLCPRVLCPANDAF